MFGLLIRLLLVMGGAFLFAQIVNRRIRLMLLPYVFSFYCIWASVNCLVNYLILLHIGNYLHYASMAFLLSLFEKNFFSRNKTLFYFLFFWSYMVLSMILGKHTLYGQIYYLLVLVGYILPSCVVFSCAVNDILLWRKTLRWTMFGAVVLALLFVQNGSLTDDVIGQSRMGLNSEALMDRMINVNAVGLMLDSVIPWCVLFLMQHYEGRWSLVLKLLAGGALLVLVAILARTGSRNASLIIVPIALYLMRGVWSRHAVKALLLVVLLALLIGSGLLFLSGSEYISDMRVFDYQADDVTTGRRDHWKMLCKPLMKGGYLLVGSGGVIDEKFGEIIMANGHSALVQMFIQSGIIGAFCFVAFVIVLFVVTAKLGVRGRLARMCFLMWVFTGVGESANILQVGFGAKVFLGMALGLCIRGGLPGEILLHGVTGRQVRRKKR